MSNLKTGAKSANEKIFDSFRKVYPVSKTLRFEAKPVGETMQNLIDRGVLDGGEKLHENYRAVKVVADRVHKKFIEKVLGGFRLKYLSDGKKDSLQEYAAIMSDKSLEKADREVLLEPVKVNLMKQVTDAFKAYAGDNGEKMLAALASQALVKDILPGMAADKDELLAIDALKKYTSFMRPYFEARDRIYKNEEKGFTIPVRIVEDNLPIHLSNVANFDFLPETLRETIRSSEAIKEHVSQNTKAVCVDDIFTVSYASLLASQSSIDAYNAVIGGSSTGATERWQGVNELINLYNQDHPDKKVRLLKKLKKQILSDRISPSWLPEIITVDTEMIEIVKGVKDAFYEIMNKIRPEYLNPSKAGSFVNAKRLASYSMGVFGHWKTAENAICELLRSRNAKKPRESEKDYGERIEKLFKHLPHVSVEDIETGAALACETPGTFNEFLCKNFVEKFAEAKTSFVLFEEAIKDGLKESLGQDKNTGELGAGSSVKAFLDSVNDIIASAKIFTDGDRTLDYDTDFYENVITPLQDFSENFSRAYNCIRNYLTKKPYSTDKVRLYFENPFLLDGWDVDCVDNKRGVILKEGDGYYLGIIAKDAKKLFSGTKHLDESSPLVLMQQKKLRESYMVLPKVAFAKNPSAVFERPEAVMALRASGKPVKEYTPDEVAMMVDFYKGVIKGNSSWDCLDFKFKDTKKYTTLNEFFQDFDNQSFNMSFVGVSREFIDEAVKNGDLYLFEITCKAMREKHHGGKDTMVELFRAALSVEKGNDIRLLGGAALYYRKASIERKVTHPAEIPIATKNPDSVKKEVTLPYHLYKDKRFTEDKFLFHVPVSIYPKADKYGQVNIHRRVRDVIAENPDMNVLGINRGERNLVSIAVTAPDGTILEQRNLNVFDNFDYRRKLAEREKERRDDRRAWKSVKEIKSIKSGYLSRVIGEIVQLVKKYNCIVAIENLDFEFKNSRVAFESNVYMQFERDLIGCLGLLLDKNEDDVVESALQLTSLGSTVEERTSLNQNGIVFLVNPSWITKTDPLTGFVNRLDTFYKSIPNSEAFMQKMDSFRYDPKTDRFLLSFCYGNVAPSKEAGDPTSKWVIQTYDERIENILDFDSNPKGEWIDRTYVLTEQFKKLFNEYDIDYDGGRDILAQLLGKPEGFWKEFYHFLRLTLQNTSWNSETREFRVVGCTADANGRIYDSRFAPERMPKDADVNAAWNIARKAHIVLENIRRFDQGKSVDDNDKKAKGPSLVVKDETWFATVQK